MIVGGFCNAFNFATMIVLRHVFDTMPRPIHVGFYGSSCIGHGFYEKIRYETGVISKKINKSLAIGLKKGYVPRNQLIPAL
jgi:NADH:ubiquinone oxidoreductase subunit B-like Fe-S oxidoreductase